MAKNNLGVGVFKIENKKYGYRIAVKKPDGTRVDTTHHLDMNGQVMTSAHAASADRARRIAEIKNPESPRNQITDCKLSEMWEVYLKSNAPQKASSTVRKYESLWRIHVEPRFGNMKISKITTVDIEDFLTELYCTKNYSYKYVESFYKLFLQLYSLAFRDKHISRDTFFEMFEHKSTKITLPKIDQSDAEEYKKIETFTKGEIARIAVDETVRRQGVGRGILDYVCEWCKKENVKRLLLDVRESNASARAFYEQYGFIVDGIRKNFYNGPNENAVLMSKALA